MEFKQSWTRIGTEDDDFYDVVESYDSLMVFMASDLEFLHLNAVSGYRVSLRKSSIISFMESGLDIMENVWEFQKLQESKKKEVELRYSWE